MADEPIETVCIRIYATPDGETHIQELVLSPATRALPTAGAVVSARRPAKVDWHKAPRPQFAINLVGELEVEVSAGARRKIGPGDLVFLEDAVGKGHITRLLTPVTILFIRVPEDFDIQAWAAAPTT